MKKYKAKFEVEIEIESKNIKDAKDLLSEIHMGHTSFGSKGSTKTINCQIVSFGETINET